MDDGRDKGRDVLEGRSVKQGWFEIEGVQKGIRTLEERIVGLDVLLEHCKDKTVLDLGCAEGLVSQWLIDNGASCAVCFDKNDEFVVAGMGNTNVQVSLMTFDLENELLINVPMDIILMIGILHKLKNWKKLLKYAVENGKIIAIRVPQHFFRNIEKFKDLSPIEWDVLSWVSVPPDKHNPDGAWVGVFKRKPPNV